MQLYIKFELLLVAVAMVMVSECPSRQLTGWI